MMRRIIYCISIFVVGTMLACMMAGCSKEVTPTNPDTPALPDRQCRVIVDHDTLALHTGWLVVGGLDMYELRIPMADGGVLTVSSMALPQAGNYCLYNRLTLYMVQVGYCVGLERDGTVSELVYGTISVGVGEDGSYEFDFQGATSDSTTVEGHFKGQAADLTHPTGSGEVTHGDSSYVLDRAAAVVFADRCESLLCNKDRSVRILVKSLAELNEGTYEVVVGTPVQSGQVRVRVVLENGDEIDASDGQLQCHRSGVNYTLAFSGSTSVGPFSGSFKGTMVSTQGF